MPYGKYPQYRRRMPARKRAGPFRLTRGKKTAVLAKARTQKFNRAVVRVVHRHQETKRISKIIAQNQPINGGGLDYNIGALAGYIVPNVMYSLNVLQGITSNSRIGHKISPLSCLLRGVVHTNTFDTVNNINFRPFDVHIIVFKHVASRDLPGATLNMKYDTAHDPPEAVPIEGTPQNEMLPMDSAYRKLAHRVFRLRPPESADQIVAANTIRTNTQTSNAPFYRKFAIKVKLPKTLTYASPTTGFPSNAWFGVGAYIVDSNGVPLGQTQIRARLYMRAQMSYKDA